MREELYFQQRWQKCLVLKATVSDRRKKKKRTGSISVLAICVIKAYGASTSTLPPVLSFNMRVALNTMFCAAQTAAFSFLGQEKHHCDRLTVNHPISAMPPAHTILVYLVDANINDWRKQQSELTFYQRYQIISLITERTGYYKKCHVNLNKMQSPTNLYNYVWPAKKEPKFH